MNRIVGLDLSLTGTAIATSEGTERLDGSKMRGMPRLCEIRRFVLGRVTAGDTVFVEGMVAHGPGGGTALALAGLGTVIRLALWERGIRYVDVPPTTLKLWATGNGQATKDMMIVAAMRDHGFPGATNDEADAWLLRCLGQVMLGLAEPAASPRFNAKIMKKIDAALAKIDAQGEAA